MEYSIIGLNKDTAEISVKVMGYPVINIALPIDENGNVPEGADLDLYINGFIPHAYLERKEKLKTPIANIESIIPLLSVDEDEQQTTNNNVIKAEPTFQQKLTMILLERDKRLTDCDWTQLPDVMAIHDKDWIKQWADYRQALRDLPDNIVDIDSNNFPIPPRA